MVLLEQVWPRFKPGNTSLSSKQAADRVLTLVTIAKPLQPTPPSGPAAVA
jgi:hypothetical protein